MIEWVSLSRVTRWSVQDMLAQPTIQVVIISNQSGIHRGKMTIDDWRTKATRIKEKLGIPLQVVEYHPAQIEVVFEQTVGVKKLAIYWERKNVERQFSHNYQRSIDFTIGNIFITVDLLQMLVCPRDCIRKSRDKKKFPLLGGGWISHWEITSRQCMGFFCVKIVLMPKISLLQTIKAKLE